MKVLLVTGSFPPDHCGVGDYSLKLRDALRQRDDIEVLVLTSGGSMDCDPVEANVLRIMRSWTLAEIPEFVKLVRRVKPDLVHLQYPSQGFAKAMLPWCIPLLSRVLGVRVIQTWHEPYSRRRALKLWLKAIAGGGLIVVRPDFVQRLHPMLRWAVWGKHFRYIRSASSIPICTASSDELADLRSEYLGGQQRLIVYFGFIYPHKGVEHLFDVCNPQTDQIVIAGESKSPEYFKRLQQKASEPDWLGRVQFPGFLSGERISALLSIADAVVLPFEFGGGDWNTSIHAATQCGSFVLTTSTGSTGYDESRNVYYAEPGNISEMRAMLDCHAGTRLPAESIEQQWQRIADEHMALYQQVLA